MDSRPCVILGFVGGTVVCGRAGMAVEEEVLCEPPLFKLMFYRQWIMMMQKGVWGKTRR